MMWVLAALLAVDAIPVGTCGYFGSNARLYQVMDYIAKIAFERGFLKPASSDFTIELYPVDTKCNGQFASGASLPLFVGVGQQEGSFYPGAGQADAPPVVAISGCGCSGSSGSVSTLGGSFKVPVVSGAATSASLSNKDMYKYFSRVIPTDDMQSLTIAKLIKEYKWDKVYGIASAETYGMGLSEALGIALNEADVEYVPKTVPFSKKEEFDPAGLVESIDRMLAEQSNQQRVFTIFAQSHVAMAVLRELDARGFVRPETVFFLTDSACGSQLNYASTVAEFAESYPAVAYWSDGYDWGKLFAKLDGLICVNPKSRGARYDSAEFENFYTSLTLADFAAAGMPTWMYNSQDWYANKSLILDTKVYYPLMFDSQSAIIFAIGKLKAEGVPEEEIKGEKLLQAIRDVKFEGLTGSIGLDAKGDRMAPYIVSNLQGTKLETVATYDSAQDTLTMTGTVLFNGGAGTAPSSRPVPCEPGMQPSQDGFGCDLCTPGTSNKLPGAEKCIPCDRGYYSDAPGALQCSTCLAGKEQPQEGNTTCIDCIPGFFAKVRGQPKCEQCEPGTYSGRAAATCTPCKIGTFATGGGSTACITCPDTFTTEAILTKRTADCTCKPGTFWNRQADTCDACQPDAVCPGYTFDAPTVYANRYGVYVGTVTTEHAKNKEEGTYSKSDGTFSKLRVYNCRPKQCLPEPEKCPKYRLGIACAICEEGRYLATCEVCNAGSGLFTLLILLIVICPFAMWAGCVASAKPYAAKTTAAFQMTSTFGIMAVFLQMLGTINGFAIVWPFEFKSLFNIGSIFLFDLENIGVGCMVGNGFGPQYYTAFLLPVVIGASMAVLLPVSNAVPKIGNQRTKLTLDSALNFLGMVYCALYISLVKMVVSALECMPNPDADHTLAKYRQVECGSSEHKVATVGMVFGMIVYVIGFFVFLLYLNVKAPERFMDARFRARCKFLVNRWRVDVWYWGSVYMVRNLCLALVAVVSSTAVDQFVMMAVTMVVFLVLSASYMPWKDERLAQFDNAVSLVVTFAVCCGIGFMHLAVVKEFYSRDTTETARSLIADCEARMSVYSIFLFVALGSAVLFFVVLLSYCVWWVKNMGDLSAQEAEGNDMLVERWQVIVQHAQFLKHLVRYIEVGTYKDKNSVIEFLNNIQARLGGVDGLGQVSARLGQSIGKAGRKARLRMSTVQVKAPVDEDATAYAEPGNCAV